MFGRFPQIPSNRAWTAALVVLWLLLAIYILWARDPLGYVILILVGIFAVLPALVVWIASRRSQRSGGDALSGEDREDEHDALREEIDQTRGAPGM